MNELFAGLVDDAGRFPPAALPMPEALARHRQDQQRGHPVHSGRFLCAAADLPDLFACVRPADTLQLSLICPPDPDAIARAVDEVMHSDQTIRLVAVEHPEPERPWDGGPPAGVRRFVEVGPGGPDTELLARLRHEGGAVKLRCGGLRAELFPSPRTLAGWLLSCVDGDVPVKATAGLHRPVRHRDDATGFVHHGFLNILLAVGRRLAGGDEDDMVATLESTDEALLAAQARAADAAAIRRIFLSYGSCDTAEPIAELERLGLVPPAAVVTPPSG
jgi:hypothetical protein